MKYTLAYNDKKEEFKIFSEKQWNKLPEDDTQWEEIAYANTVAELTLFLNQFILNMTVTEKN